MAEKHDSYWIIPRRSPCSAQTLHLCRPGLQLSCISWLESWQVGESGLRERRLRSLTINVSPLFRRMTAERLKTMGAIGSAY